MQGYRQFYLTRSLMLVRVKLACYFPTVSVLNVSNSKRVPRPTERTYCGMFDSHMKQISKSTLRLRHNQVDRILCTFRISFTVPDHELSCGSFEFPPRITVMAPYADWPHICGHWVRLEKSRFMF